MSAVSASSSRSTRLSKISTRQTTSGTISQKRDYDKVERLASLPPHLHGRTPKLKRKNAELAFANFAFHSLLRGSGRALEYDASLQRRLFYLQKWRLRLSKVDGQRGMLVAKQALSSSPIDAVWPLRHIGKPRSERFVVRA